MLNKQLLKSMVANLYRSDLQEAGLHGGRHGFSFDMRLMDPPVASHPEFAHMSILIAGTETRLPVNSFVPFFQSDAETKRQGPYLASFLTETQRQRCYNASNWFLFDHLVNNGLVMPQICWSQQAGGHAVEVLFKHSDFAPLEGEASLSVLFDGVIVYSLAFSIIPGDVVGCRDPFVLFIGGLQGRAGRRAEIAAATEISNGLHPRMLLLTSVQALCDAWNIGTISAVSARQHLSCTTPERLQSFTRIYDEFWTKLGGLPNSPEGQVFLIPVGRQAPKHQGHHHHRAVRRQSLQHGVRREISDFGKLGAQGSHQHAA